MFLDNCGDRPVIRFVAHDIALGFQRSTQPAEQRDVDPAIFKLLPQVPTKGRFSDPLSSGYGYKGSFLLSQRDPLSLA